MSVLLTGEREELDSLSEIMNTQKRIHIEDSKLSTVTLTTYGGVRSDTLQKALHKLSERSIEVYETIHSALSLTFVVKNSQRNKTIDVLYKHTD